MSLLFLYTKYKEGAVLLFTQVYASRAHVWQMLRYGVSGVMGGLVQVACFYFFVEWLAFWYIHGVVLSFLISLIFTFILQKLWTFQDYSVDSIRRQSSLYILIALSALVLNIVSMYVLVDICHLWHIGAQVAVVFFVGTYTFLMNRLFTFSNKNIRRIKLTALDSHDG